MDIAGVPNGHSAAINVDKTHELAVSADVGAVNGNGHGVGLSPPAADSPATPVESFPAPDVKIDLDYPEQESDVRNEPMDVKPIDPYPIDITTQNTTPTPQSEHAMDTTNGDVTMEDDPPPATADASMTSSPITYTPRERPTEDEDGQPPAKRPRILSDADKSSLTHSATPPPASAAASNATSPVPAPPTTAATDMSMASSSTTPTQSHGSTQITNNQFKYCQSCVRSLKKLKDSIPFLKPVDPVALNIPHYPTIIKHPMDFSTIERKLNSTNPAKPDPNPENPRYMTVDEFAHDVRLIFNNCLIFNGPDHVVSHMGKRVEEVFEKQMKGMPPAEAKPAPPPKKATPPPPPPPVTAPMKKQAPPVRRASTATAPPPRRNEPTEPISRPKREIHPPAPRDLPFTSDVSKKNRKPKRMDDGVAEQMKYCGKLLNDLFKKQYAGMAHPFYEPVDWVKLDLPSYPKIVKRPMDLGTMKTKLDNGEYPNPHKFHEDFKLMIRNCMAFNPTGTPVCTAGQQLQKLFDEKWKGLPPLRPPPVSDDDDDDDEDSDVERQRQINSLEQQIETMKTELDALKTAQRTKERKKKQQKAKEREPAPPPPPPPPRSQPKPQPKASTSTTKKKSSGNAKKPIPDDDVLTFEQKKDLSETIGKLEGAKLEKVINIIHEGVPEIRDSTEEIELEIDLLPAAVLTKLYNFVIRPLKQPAVKRNRTGKGTGTGGLKRKSMDEDVEAEKIRQLEQRMALFEQGAGAGSVSAPPQMHQGGHGSDSDSSSGSDSSGSDSE